MTSLHTAPAHPQTVTCPTCKALPGRSCVRTSGRDAGQPRASHCEKRRQAARARPRSPRFPPQPTSAQASRPRVYALSLTQPWAWLVVHGGKRVENRTWHLHQKVRGQVFLVHAAKTMTHEAYDFAAEFAERLGVKVPAREDLRRGGIVGRARAVDCLCPGMAGGLMPGKMGQTAKVYGGRPGQPSPPLAVESELAGRLRVDTRWWMEGQHGFVLDEVAELPFTPFSGSRQFFEVPSAVLEVPPLHGVLELGSLAAS